MDAPRFDALTRALSAAGSRRGLLGALLTLPGLGSLLALLAPDEAAAKGRRKRRKKRHKHGQDPPKNRKGKRKGKGRNGKGRKGKHQKRCEAKSRATICAGKCGTIKNAQTCQEPVDCGSCACEPPCPICQTCEAGPTTPGACVPDPAQVGDKCASDLVCQADGACACDAGSCGGTTPICAEGTCVACSEARPCSTGCCAGDGSCQPGMEDAAFCGGDGEICQVCPSTAFCQEAICQACDICPDECRFDSIQAAIDDSSTSDGDTFTICPGRYVGLTTFSKSITIQGAGDGDDAASNTILDGNLAGSVVTIGESQTVTLRGLRITRGDDNLGGGIRKLEESTLTLSDCTVTGNEANNGAGILNFGTLTLDRCEVTHNTADNGGGLFIAGGGMVNLNDCTVSHNKALSGNGGALYDNSESHPTTPLVFVSGCTMTNNLAADLGGAVYSDSGFVCIDTATIFANNLPDNFDGSFQVGGCDRLRP